MREIKFRAIIENDFLLAKSAKQMGDKKISHTVLYFTFEDILKKQLDFPERELLIPYYLKGVAKINQYIGLKDKNVREIYEDDIIVQEYLGIKRFYEVKYILKKSSFYPFADDFQWCDYEFRFVNNKVDFKDVKVVGNIYENPELLENNK